MTPSLTLLHNVLTDGALHLDASTLEGRFMHCPREFYYYTLRKREAERDFSGRQFGKFVHDHMLKPHYEGKPHADVATAMSDAWHAAPPIIDETDYRSLDYAQQLYTKYCEQYSSEPFDVLGVELPFAVPLCTLPLPDGTNIPVLYTGKIDLIIRMHMDGTLWVRDHKTSKIAGDTFWQQWRNSTQMYGYVYAAEQQLQQSIAGYSVNALFIRQPTRTGAGIELAQQNYLVGDSPATHREALSRWHTNVLAAVASIGDCLARDFFPQHTCACVRRYGVCEYHDTCRVDPGREALIDTNLYRTVTWSPLE